MGTISAEVRNVSLFAYGREVQKHYCLVFLACVCECVCVLVAYTSRMLYVVATSTNMVTDPSDEKPNFAFID